MVNEKKLMTYFQIYASILEKNVDKHICSSAEALLKCIANNK